MERIGEGQQCSSDIQQYKGWEISKDCRVQLLNLRYQSKSNHASSAVQLRPPTRPCSSATDRIYGLWLGLPWDSVTRAKSNETEDSQDMDLVWSTWQLARLEAK